MTDEGADAHGGGFFVPHDIDAPIKGAYGGPLAGLTAAVKDMYDIAGWRTGGGNPEWLAAQKPATSNAVAITKILNAGATIIGKTICDEFFYSVTGINAHYGAPANLRAPDRMPGGSSSGSAAATAAGVCDFALGSDTGGSIRVPASFCGLYGLRPTHGRVDLSGAMAMSPSFDTAGWFASGPGIFRKVGKVLLEGAGAYAPIHELIVADDAFAEADSEVAKFFEEMLTHMSSALPDQRHDRIAPEGLDAWREIFRIEQAWEVWKTYGDFVEQHHPDLGPGIRERMAFAATTTELEAAAASKARTAAREDIRFRLRPGTLLALPAAPCVPPPVDLSPEAQDSFRRRTFRLTCIASLSGLPQIVIPAGTISGYPIGLSFIGWDRSDETLLDLAVKLAPYCGVLAR